MTIKPCGGCQKRAMILRQAGAALKRNQPAQAARRLAVVAASAAKAARSTIIPRRSR